MPLEIDVLIIYADRDDEAQAKADLGWVSQFKKFLEYMLGQIVGSKPNVMLKGEYDHLVDPDFSRTAVVVPVLSKEFVRSPQCMEHLEKFCRTLHSNNPKRVFKVFKTPLSASEQPGIVREQLGYELYQLDPDSGEIREYTDYFSSDAEREYWMKMVDLSYDIYDSLRDLGGHVQRSEIHIYPRKSIYLAETGHDLSVQRNIIKRELQRHGYTILPNQTLPHTYQDLEHIIRRDLDSASLSIHLIGNSYGEIPEGTDKSIVDIQNRLAAEKTQKAREEKNEFSRLIWISPNLSLASEKQKAFIENIKRDVEAQEGAEILQTSLEDFKNIMREELMEVSEKNSPEGLGERCIYVMHDRVDHQDVKPLVEFFERSGFKVLMPEFEGELLDVRQKHINNLKNLDAAIIYKGKVNDQWVQMKALDLLKAPGFGRKKPIVAKAIVAAPGASVNSESFKRQNMRVIAGDRDSSLESLKSFLAEFNS